MRKETLTAIDVFCGAGGLTLGLKRAGFKVVCGIESWAIAAKSHKHNFNDVPCITYDIRDLTRESLGEKLGLLFPVEIDLVAGGPPCQGFSVQRIGQDSDLRNNLVLEFGRFVSEIRPRMFLMENVPGLLGKRGSAVFDRFVDDMMAAGYAVTHKIIDAADFGVPQRRRRVFVAGSHIGISPPYQFPSATHKASNWVTVREAISDLPEPPADFSPHPGDRLHRRFRLSEDNLERLRHIPEGGGMEDLPVKLRVDCHKNGPDRIGHRFVYGRLAGDEPAGTITARFDSFTRGKFAHPTKHRNITLREGARLQTFDDGFVFCGTQEEIAAQIGNAVPPRLAEVLARSAARHLESRDKPATDLTSAEAAASDA